MNSSTLVVAGCEPSTAFEITIDGAVALHERAIELREAGRTQQAEEACRSAVEAFRALEGEESPDLANALVEHARLLEQLDRLAAAEAQAERALEILRALASDALEATSLDSAEAVHELVMLAVRARLVLASVLVGRSGLERAEIVVRDALTSIEVRIPNEKELEAESFNLLGMIHKYQGRFDDAERAYRKALALLEAAGCDAEPTLIHNLGGLAHSRGDFVAGEPLARRALELRLGELGAEHPLTAADRAAWGAILEGLGRLDEAEAAYADALRVFSSCFGPVSREVAAARNSLGSVQHTLGKLEQAEHSYREALAIRRALLGESHFDLALTMNDLAVVLDDRDRHAEAREFAAAACAMFEVELGAQHPHAVGARANLAALSSKTCPGTA